MCVVIVMCCVMLYGLLLYVLCVWVFRSMCLCVSFVIHCVMIYDVFVLCMFVCVCKLFMCWCCAHALHVLCLCVLKSEWLIVCCVFLYESIV